MILFKVEKTNIIYFVDGLGQPSIGVVRFVKDNRKPAQKRNKATTI